MAGEPASDARETGGHSGVMSDSRSARPNAGSQNVVRLDPRIAEFHPAGNLLAGRAVLVTGAGDGIGRAIARACARHGATVVLLGRTVTKLEDVYDSILSAGGPEPAIYPMDLSGAMPADHEALAGRIGDELGRLDGLVHNAALLGTLGPVEHLSPDDWQEIMQVNVNAPFLLTRALVPLLRRTASEHGHASVIFTSSGVGRRGRAYWGTYSVSKFAIEGLNQVLADELDGGSGVRVNSLNPGPVRTRMRAKAFPAEDPETLITPEEAARAWLWLLDSRDHHGEALDAQVP